jgi:CopG family nickel-responsive transcriptional regulator
LRYDDTPAAPAATAIDPETLMERFTISLDEELAAAFDALISQRGYTTRSEAVRDILRDRLQRRDQTSDGNGFCVASLSYVYNHHERQLAERLAELQHAHHELTVATMHVHLDHDECLETVSLKGPARTVRQFAEKIIAEKGVRHGQLNLVSVELGAAHKHDGTRHRHLTPRH